MVQHQKPMMFLEFFRGQYSDHCSFCKGVSSDLVLSPGTNITLYADDILLSKPINDNHDFINLQVEINFLFQWTASRCLTFKPAKCKSMLVTRKGNLLVAVLLLKSSNLHTSVLLTYPGVTHKVLDYTLQNILS